MSDPDYSRSHGGEALAARLRRLSDRLDRDGARIYADHDIRFEQRWYGILRQLVANGPMTVGDVAQVLRISHASVSEAVKSMLARGIVRADSPAEDRRRRVLTLTPDGDALVARLTPLWDAFNAAAGELNIEAGDVVAALSRLDDALERRGMRERINDRLPKIDIM